MPTINETVSARLAELGWTRRDLARRMGRSPQTLATLMTGSFTGASARRRLENALDTPLWTPYPEFAARRKVIAFLGVDPATLTRPELNALVKRHRRAAGFPARVRPRAAAIKALELYARQATAS